MTPSRSAIALALVPERLAVELTRPVLTVLVMNSCHWRNHFHDMYIPEWVMSAIIMASTVSMMTFSYLVVGAGTVSSGGTLTCLSLAIKNALLVVY